jgi:hypothetical protein
MTQATDTLDHVARIRRVADSMCSAHAGIRDKLGRRALFLDIAILALSTWLVALAFVEPRIGLELTPFGLSDKMWIGMLAVATFFLSVVQLKTDWKGRADAHDRTLGAYAAVKREAGYVLASEIADENAHRRIIDRYDMAAAICVPIPEREFLKQKRRHLLKIAVSSHLDVYPSASIFLTKIRFWWRDNLDGRSK